MAEYITKYPKTVSFFDGLKEKIFADKKDGVEQLHIVVKENVEKIFKILQDEGFTKVKFEHKQPDQIGSGINLKLKKPWEMHIRMVTLDKGRIGIHAEVEVSRDYLQHLFSQRTPVVYEVEEILKKYHVEYNVWHNKIKYYLEPEMVLYNELMMIENNDPLHLLNESNKRPK